MMDPGERAVQFVRRLTHTKGRWAGQPFQLLPWQEELLRRLFGTLRPDGTRQYRRAFLEIAKKNGKSELAAAIALFLLFADHEPGAEVYSAAADRDQASIVFNTAVQMVQNAPALRKRAKIVESTKRIVVPSTNSFYRVLSAESYTKHGFNVHGVIFDELHAQPTRDLWDTLTEGSGAARRQPLILALTTAGVDRNSICYEVHDYAEKVRDGIIDDPTFLPIIYKADEADDWQSEETWGKANPSLGATVDLEELRESARRAKEVPALQNAFRRLRLNQWVSQATRWLDLAAWEATAGTVDRMLLRGRDCYAGLDLSTTTDLTALVLVFPMEDGTVHVLPLFWIPEQTALAKERRDRVPYTAWARQGLITLTPGNAVDYTQLEQDIRVLATEFRVLEWSYDRWNATMLVQRMQEDGAMVVPVGLNFDSTNAPMQHLENLVLQKRLVHGNNPILNWQADNLTVEQNTAGYVRPSKAKSRQRIDGMVALVMALSRLMVHAGQGRSVYEERDVLVV